MQCTGEPVDFGLRVNAISVFVPFIKTSGVPLETGGNHIQINHCCLASLTYQNTVAAAICGNSLTLPSVFSARKPADQFIGTCHSSPVAPGDGVS